jgi:hypothetical protein
MDLVNDERRRGARFGKEETGLFGVEWANCSCLFLFVVGYDRTDVITSSMVRSDLRISRIVRHVMGSYQAEFLEVYFQALLK